MSDSSTLSVLAVMLALAGCGGGGGADLADATSATPLSGTVAAGLFKNADVKVYDATVGESTPIATATTAADGTYALTLPVGFYHPVLVVASAKADGSSHLIDEVFGDQSMPGGFAMRAVIPSGVSKGTALTGYVTPYTNLMYQIVGNKIGKADVNAAINQARSLVNQLTHNADPLTVNPATDAGMVTLLAAVSNLAYGSGSNDPGSCHSQTTAAAKIACTISTLGTAIAPMLATADTTASSPRVLQQNIVSALAYSVNSLNASTVASNNGNVAAVDVTGAMATDYAYLSNLAMQSDLIAPDSATASGITQAKALFANLRASILPYAGTNGSGFINTQSKAIQAEMNTLPTASMHGLDQVGNIATWTFKLLIESIVPGACNTTAANVALCTFQNGHTVTLTKTGPGAGTWDLDDGFHGSITLVTSGSTVTMTMNGNVDPMVQGAGNKTKVGLGNGSATNPVTGVTCTGDDAALVSTWPTSLPQNNNVTVNFTLQGTLKNLVPDSLSGLTTCSGYAPNLKLNFGVSGTPSTVTINPVDYSQDSGNFTGTFTTKNYSFTGNLVVNSVTAAQTASGTMVNGGKAGFTGIVNGVGLNYRDINDNQQTQDTDATNNFTLLVGNLAANIAGTHYDPSQPSSSSNYQTGTMVFSGTTFLSATDPGLKLILSINDTAWKAGTGTLIFNDYNKGVSLTGTGNDDEVSKTGSFTIFDGNGISVTAGSNINHPVVSKGGVQFGTIQNGIVTYSDGTFESLSGASGSSGSAP